MKIAPANARDLRDSTMDRAPSATLPRSPRSHSASPAPVPRDPTQRVLYAREALASVPRLLGAIDRNPFRPSYGCFDREFWHYRVASFPSGMHQEAVWPLALVYVHRLPGNRWRGNPRLKDLIVAGLRYAAQSSHADGSCDDYYPFERALGAAVFSLRAAASAYALLELDLPDVRRWLETRAEWLTRNDESGRLANHHALAALGLAQVARIADRGEFLEAARTRIQRLLEWQSDEGWFEEYGGADPGYQTITIEALANYARLDPGIDLRAPLARAVEFARLFLRADGGYGGEYGARGTRHFHPHGFELLAGENLAAAQLADGYLRAQRRGTLANFSDDRMYVHRLAGLIESYLDWSPTRPAASRNTTIATSGVIPLGNSLSVQDRQTWLPQARLWVLRNNRVEAIISAARGGVFRFRARGNDAVIDAGLIVETSTGRFAVSQSHDLTRDVALVGEDEESPSGLGVSGPLHWTRFETLTPVRQAIFHLGMSLVGRWSRTLVRRLLQRRLITGRRPAPIRLSREFRWSFEGEEPTFRVTDSIELIDRRVRVKRMAFAVDLQAAYVAASDVYQKDTLAPWHDLSPYVDALNTDRQVTIERRWPLA